MLTQKTSLFVKSALFVKIIKQANRYILKKIYINPEDNFSLYCTKIHGITKEKLEYTSNFVKDILDSVSSIIIEGELC